MSCVFKIIIELKFNNNFKFNDYFKSYIAFKIVKLCSK